MPERHKEGGHPSECPPLVVCAIRRNNSLKTLSEKVGGTNEECSVVTLKTRFKLAGYGAEATIVKCIVIPDIESRAGIRVPAKKELAAKVASH